MDPQKIELLFNHKEICEKLFSGDLQASFHLLEEKTNQITNHSGEEPILIKGFFCVPSIIVYTIIFCFCIIALFANAVTIIFDPSDGMILPLSCLKKQDNCSCPITNVWPRTAIIILQKPASSSKIIWRKSFLWIVQRHRSTSVAAIYVSYLKKICRRAFRNILHARGWNRHKFY